LAENVVSTVKSGLFRVAAGVAAGLFWGSAPTPPQGEIITFLTLLNMWFEKIKERKMLFKYEQKY
jgi:hypothetical protein